MISIKSILKHIMHKSKHAFDVDGVIVFPPYRFGYLIHLPCYGPWLLLLQSLPASSNRDIHGQQHGMYKFGPSKSGLIENSGTHMK